MNCHEAREALARGGASAGSEALRAHRAACAACDQEARALALLRLGSAHVADGPRAGFDARLHARIASEPEPALTWADGIGLVARPSLVLATLALLLSIALTGWSFVRPSSSDDLALVTGGDPLLAAVSVDGIDAIDDSTAAADAP